MQSLQKHFEAAGGIVLDPDNRVLVVTNQIGTVTFPKGTREADETYQETATREVLEESGLKDITLVRELGVILRDGFKTEGDTTRSVTKSIHMFLFHTNKVELKPITKDVLHAEWIDPNEVENRLTWKEEIEFFMQNRDSLCT